MYSRAADGTAGLSHTPGLSHTHGRTRALRSAPSCQAAAGGAPGLRARAGWVLAVHCTAPAGTGQQQLAEGAWGRLHLIPVLHSHVCE